MGGGGTDGVAYYNEMMRRAGRPSPRDAAAANSKHEGPRRILAIDYGRRRIGLALSDELGLTAQPHATLQRRNRRDDLRRLRAVCRENEVGYILVGHPLHITGEAGEMAGEAARFAARLEKELGIEAELVDERLTTWEAHRTLAETQAASRRKTDAGSVDDIAAALLLRDYLEQKREKPERRS